MAEVNKDIHSDDEDQRDGVGSYRPPAEKSLAEMLQQDQDDASLQKYKETLLGNALSGGLIVDGSSPNCVLVRKLALLVDDRPSLELDLTCDLNKLKDNPFVIKEGITYRIRIEFFVQREIVTGLKYVQKTSRKGILVDKMSHMVGSYGPKSDIQWYTTPNEEAPSGLLSRGHYNVKSLFTDDDGNEHLKWEWSFDIKKDWH